MTAGDRSDGNGGENLAGGDYNLLPYPSLPVSYAQPAHLAALAMLHGLSPPDADRARVLELGCASGGNIIPLAARFPNARFTGLDLAARQIADGQKRITLLGLGNIDLRQADVSTVALDGEAFDYIICHGLYSWVAPPIQDAILRLTGRCLSPDGVAAISYNVLPGWHLRRVVRDICLDAASGGGSPQERVARARQALEYYASGARADDPYGLLLKAEAKRLSLQPAAYILGEFLSPENSPCTFTSFHARAADHGLAYICEGDLNASTSPFGTGDAECHRISAEQRLDYASGRPFRRSLLCRADRAARISTAPQPVRLSRLYIASDIQRDETRSDDGKAVFRDRRGGTITAAHDALASALELLAQAYPETRTLTELSSGDSTAQSKMADALLAMVGTGQASVYSLPLRSPQKTGSRPNVSDLTRTETQAGQPWITNLHHTGIPLTREQAAIVSLFDGTHELVAIAETYAVMSNTNNSAATAQVAAVYAYMKRNGLL